MTAYTGRPFSPIESQVDMMKAHVTRGIPISAKSEGPRTLQLAVPGAWTKQAKCIGDFSRFTDMERMLKDGKAAELCAGCPVIEQCLSAAMREEHGLTAGNRYGVRGGLSPKERAALVLPVSCGREHACRWDEKRVGRSPRCLERVAEDAREAYRLNRENPDWKANRLARMRESRSVQLVSCLECQSEMRLSNFKRHRALVHGEERAA